MRRRAHCIVALLVLGASITMIRTLAAADWPTYCHDLARSGVTDETLSARLHPQWVYKAPHAPIPAWPEPGRELNRLAFDYAYEITAAGGLVYYGSSADHKVYAIELESGLPRWSFFTEGPVRFAPTIEAGRVFACSDDGWLYCLSAEDGTLLWRFRGGPKDERMLGNGQMISRWPLRSGVAVEGETLYFSAGMWPNEGVYVYALDAENGEVLWKNETSGTDYRAQPHPPAVAVTGVAPQGCLLGHEGQIFVPTGRNVPAAFDRLTGKLLYYHSRPATWGDRWGGTWNMLSGGLLFSWRCHVAPDSDVRVGEFQWHKDDGLIAFDAKTGDVRRDFPGKRRAVVHDGTLYMAGSGRIDAYDFDAWTQGAKPSDCVKWSVPHVPTYAGVDAVTGATVTGGPYGRAYAMILAGGTLVVGGNGSVTALAADTGRFIWEDQTSGQARSLAVADGRLLVSTTTGQITCYGSVAVSQPRVVSSEARTPVPEGGESDSSGADLARRILDETGKKAGYCLVLGAGDGRFLNSLAEQSDLKICCLEPNAEAVASARRILDQAKRYGVQVVVHHAALADVAYPEYFADLIILHGGAAPGLRELSAERVYRVLRPHGGTIYAATDGMTRRPDVVSKWLLEGKVPADEITTSADTVRVVRGRLPGAGDWTHQYADAAKSGCSTDRRVRLPLKLLWFGDPGPARMIARHWKGPAPLCVNGRMFVIGQYSLMAVDAYNGRLLWRRELPQAGRFPANTAGSNVAVDEDRVYVATGKKCALLDAVTGNTVRFYDLPLDRLGLAGQETKSLAWSYLAVGSQGVLGSVGDPREGRHLFLVGKDGKTRWAYSADGTIGNNAISMDQGLVYLIEQTSPERVARAKRLGERVPASWRLVALDVSTGEVAWKTEAGIAGRTELWSAQGVLVATSGGGMSGYEASTGRLLYNGNVSMARFPVIVGDTIYGEPAAYDLQTGKPVFRKDPFTSAESPWSFARSYGCGSVSAGPNLLLFRSGTLGMYDLAGDSGIHNFGGIRAGCHVNAVVAGGLVLMPPGDASCTCSYCFQTTIALVPTRKEESWSVFYNRLPTTPVRQVALNLGSPGDQRDGEGLLWLASPRPETPGRRQDIAIPFRFAGSEVYGAYRVNADNVQIAGADRPWVYTSGLKGPLRAELDLEIFDRAISSWPADRAPVMDGRADEPCWDGYKAVSIDGDSAWVSLRHDEQNLYLAYHRPAAVDSAGNVIPWKKSLSEQDAPVWNDDSFEVFLSAVPAGRDEPGRKCLHLGVSASAARYDSLWTYVTPSLPDCDIPRVAISVDGDEKDWGETGLKVVSLPGVGGKLRPAKNFDPSLRVGWNEHGILLLAHVKDDVVRTAPANEPLEHGDCVEVFVAPQRGSADSYRLLIAPETAPGGVKPQSRFDDYRKAAAGEALTAEIAVKKVPEGYIVEACLPWKNLKMAPRAGTPFGLQLFIHDDDGRGEKHRFHALWHPAGDPRRDALAYQTFQLAEQASPPIVFTRSEKPDTSGLHTAVSPHPFPLALPPLGAQGEDPSYAGVWSSGVLAGETSFVAEIAIPWATLAAEGFRKDQVMVNLSDRGPLRKPPVLGQQFERLLAVPRESIRPKTLSVRLHFAEIGGAKPGERVFDVMLQGNVVLKDFDIAAHGANRAVVRQFDKIAATRALSVELVSKSADLKPGTAPTLCGIEIVAVEDAP